MKRVNIAEAKTHLSKLIRGMQSGGEGVVICDRNVPVAELRPLAVRGRRPRPLGPEQPDFDLGPEFFEPLPPGLLRALEGYDG